MSLIGPKNIVLRQEFLEIIVKKLKETSYDFPKEHDNLFMFIDRESNKFYNSFLSNEPVVKYNNEDFYITNIMILDKPYEKYKERTYLDIWKECDNNRPLPTICPCNDSEEDNKEDNKYDGKFQQFSYLDKINYEGTYFSQPAVNAYGSGEQYQWIMVFNYNQEDIDLTLYLGPKRHINSKVITGHTGSMLSENIIEEEQNKLVYNYKPSDLYFDDDFLIIIKNTLINKNKYVTYKNIKYELIDHKFCRTDNFYPSCGCFYGECYNMSTEEGINQIKQVIIIILHTRVHLNGIFK